MQILSSLSAIFSLKRRGQRKFSLFISFLVTLCLMISIFTVAFHFIMQYEGYDYPWITGFYWTLTVMSSAGISMDDIAFTSDLGHSFTVLVLLSGVLFFMVLLPFTFIQHFFVPWLEAMRKKSAPREVPPTTEGHVILVGIGPMTLTLADVLSSYKFRCVLLCQDSQTTLDLLNQDYNAVMGEHDDSDAYQRLRLPQAAMLVAMDNDPRNTSIVFTAREAAPHVPITARVENDASIDILKLAGSTHVYQFHNLLGKALARRVLNPNHPSSVLTTFNQLVVAEAPVMRSRLEGKTLQENKLRSTTGVNIVGVWQRGRFFLPTATTRLSSTSVIVTAGTASQTAALNDFLRGEKERPQPDAPVLILGGGQVGLAAAAHLKECGLKTIIVDKRPLPQCEHVIQGDAADLGVLEKAGLSRTASVIITTHDDDVNIYLTIYCRRLRPDLQIITRANFDRNVNMLHAAGADLVLSLSSMISNTLLNQLSPGKVLLLNEGLNIFRSRVPSRILGRRLLESGIRSSTNCSVVAIENPTRDMIVNPLPDYVFSENDEMFLIGDSAAEKAFHNLFGQP